MILKRPIILISLMLLSSCATEDRHGRISELDTVKVPIKEVKIEGGLEKAMQAYKKFLDETPESSLTPEALRRLADLKIEKTYGIVTDEGDTGTSDAKPTSTVKPIEKQKAGQQNQVNPKPQGADKQKQEKKAALQTKSAAIANVSESQKAFEKRATKQETIKSSAGNFKPALPPGEPGADLQNADASDAIKLYNKLLVKYPRYERNDQVLYQLSRAYEETGQVDKAMGIMNRLIKQYPKSRYVDEVQFRRGEYFFTRRKYLDAEDAYGAVLGFGVGSVYYARALFKRGWTYYKQELYEEAVGDFIKLLDYKVSTGYDFEQKNNEIEQKRTDDTFRVISLSFSNLGGSKSVQDYFAKNGSRTYEDQVYSHLAEFYFTKRRYSDAANTYNAFVERNPFHKKSPFFSMRVIDIYKKGHFPRLVIEAKKQYASTYGVRAEYWNYFEQSEFPEVLGYVKTNIFDLAKYYHSLYQNKKFVKDRPQNFSEASHWYREFLNSFPKDKQSPDINFQLAELLLENKNYNEAAKEYERTAYDYPVNGNSTKAAYAAVYAYREYLKVVPEIRQMPVKRNIIRSSLRLVDTYPHHKKATVVLGAAVDDLFNMQDYKEAIKNALRLVGEYSDADTSILRGAWLVMAHSSFRLENFADAETGYTEVLRLMAQNDKNRSKLTENLAASIYKQGERARNEEDYKSAVRNFLRIATVAPLSKIRPTAEYDAAAVLIQTMDLERAIQVLTAFRENYPGHKLQHDVTKKIAYAYKELQKYTLAGKEYERVAAESRDEELIREAMLTAADMYDKAKDTGNSLRVYHQFVVKFPKPLEFALETYYKIAMLYKSIDDLENYRKTLRHIIKADASAGAERTDRTRYLAAEASLVIIEPRFDEFVAIKLVSPLKKSMKRKQSYMKSLIASYSKLVDYKVGDVTAASTYYLAETYYNFSRSLLSSEIPKGLSALELEEFKTQLEDQAYPFEEKAISVHEKNVELLRVGVYSPWIDRSIEKLAKLVPARFAKYESRMAFIDDMYQYRYASPRYQREDAATIYVENLNFFRYASQIQEKNEQKGLQSAETVNEGGTTTANNEPVPSDSGKTQLNQGARENSVENASVQTPRGDGSGSTAAGKPAPGGKAANQPAQEGQGGSTATTVGTESVTAPKSVPPQNNVESSTDKPSATSGPVAAESGAASTPPDDKAPDVEAEKSAPQKTAPLPAVPVDSSRTGSSNAGTGTTVNEGASQSSVSTDGASSKGNKVAQPPVPKTSPNTDGQALHTQVKNGDNGTAVDLEKAPESAANKTSESKPGESVDSDNAAEQSGESGAQKVETQTPEQVNGATTPADSNTENGVAETSVENPSTDTTQDKEESNSTATSGASE